MRKEKDIDKISMKMNKLSVRINAFFIILNVLLILFTFVVLFYDAILVLCGIVFLTIFLNLHYLLMKFLEVLCDMLQIDYEST